MTQDGAWPLSSRRQWTQRSCARGCALPGCSGLAADTPHAHPLIPVSNVLQVLLSGAEQLWEWGRPSRRTAELNRPSYFMHARRDRRYSCSLPLPLCGMVEREGVDIFQGMTDSSVPVRAWVRGRSGRGSHRVASSPTHPHTSL